MTRRVSRLNLLFTLTFLAVSLAPAVTPWFESSGGEAAAPEQAPIRELSQDQAQNLNQNPNNLGRAGSQIEAAVDDINRVRLLEATWAFEDVLEHDLENPVASHARLARDYNNLGVVSYLQALRHSECSSRLALLRQAEQYLTRAVSTYVSSNEADASGQMRARNNRLLVLRELGKAAGAQRRD